MFKVEKYCIGSHSKFNPEYKVVDSHTKRILGFGNLNECEVICTALNSKYFPQANYNNKMKIVLQNED